MQSNNTLWIYDRLNNFKGAKMIRNAIINKKDTTFVSWNNKPINYQLYDKVIFDFNEDRINKKKLQTLETIANNFLKENSNITLFNNPALLKHTSNKYKSYELLKGAENEVVKIPRFSSIISKDIDYFPVILKTNANATNDGKDCICKNYKELVTGFKKNQLNKKNIIISQLINSYDKIEKKYHKVRWMVFGDKIIEQQVSFNNKFNVHNKYTSSKMYLNARPRYEEFKNRNIKEIQSFLNYHKSVFGEGFFGLDVIFNFEENKIYLCETSIKFYDCSARYMPNKNQSRVNHFTSEMLKYLNTS